MSRNPDSSLPRPANLRGRTRVGSWAIAALWIVALAAGITTSVLTSRAVPVELMLDPGRIRPELGLAYEIDLAPPGAWWWAARGDSLAAGEVSDLVLLDPRGELGPAHARHPEIRDLGGGRYSHWHGRLIFSTRDGADPRTGAPTLRVRFTPGVAAWIEQVAIAAFVAALLVSWWRFVSPRPMLGRAGFLLTAGALLFSWNAVIGAFVPHWIAVQEDSMSYLNNDSMRTVGYPLLLRAVTLVTGDLALLVRLQVNAVALSIVMLGYAMAAVVGASRAEALAADRLESAKERAPAPEPIWGVGVLFMALAGTAGRVFETSFTVMADGPYMALSCTAAALLGVAAIRRSMSVALLLGAVVALAVLMRPVGLAFVPALLLPWWWHRAPRMLASLAPVVAILGAAAAFNLAARGSFGLSTMGSISLAGHVAWMIDPETVPGEAELAARIEARLAPVIARRPPLAWPLDYYLYTSDEYNELLYRHLLPEVDAWVAERFPAPAGGAGSEVVALRAKERSRVLDALARGPVLRRPGAYAKHVLANVIGAWHWHGRAAPIAPALARAVAPGVECLSRLEPGQRAPFDSWISAPTPDRSWQRALAWERLRYPLEARPRIAASIACACTLAGVLLIPTTRRRRAARRVPTEERVVAAGSASPARSTGLAMSSLLPTPAARLLGALSLMAWASIVVIALSATVIFRYVDAIDPLVTGAVLLAGALAWLAPGTSRNRSSHIEKVTSASSRSP